MMLKFYNWLKFHFISKREFKKNLINIMTHLTKDGKLTPEEAAQKMCDQLNKIDKDATWSFRRTK